MQAAKRLGIPDSSLWSWIRLSRQGKLKAAEGGTAPVKRGASELEAENAWLRRELANAKADLECAGSDSQLSFRETFLAEPGGLATLRVFEFRVWP